MSEEEILKVLNSYTTDLYHSYKSDVILKAIAGLLDLYNKEKEKNNIKRCPLFNPLGNNCTEFRKDFVSKDKIQNKLEALKEELLKEDNYIEFLNKKSAYYTLKSLLESEV